jgi:hypothetical protein
MKEGTTISVVRDHDTKPTESRNTRLVAAALSSGAMFATEAAYSDTVEQTPNGAKRTVTWLMDGAAKLHFEPIEGAESITFDEFRKRYESLPWCEANANHPIAYLRAMNDQHNRMLDKVKTMRPMLLIRKGKRIAIVPSGSDEASKATREQILSDF